jgi:hypothetical protein
MNTLTRGALNTLMTSEGEPHVSIFMPAHRISDFKQDRIRLRRLIKQAEELMVQGGTQRLIAQKLLSPAREGLGTGSFSQHRSEGLALFISPGFFRDYHVPLALEELVVVGRRFCVGPLLPLLTEAEEGKFYILALSLNGVRLFKAAHRSVREVELPEGVPMSLAEALKYDDQEVRHQFYSGTPGWSGGEINAGGGVGKAGAVFYGQDAGSDVKKEHILRYFRQVDHGLHSLLRDERAPLVLAAVTYLLPIYREANTYPHLVGEGIEGNPDDIRAEELRDQAWPIVHPLLEKAQYEAIERYMQLAGTGQTCTDIKEVVPASYQGQVDTLFIARGAHLWGTFDPGRADGALVDLHDTKRQRDEELLNAAAVHTLLNHGTVYVIERALMPEGAVLAALLRY